MLQNTSSKPDAIRKLGRAVDRLLDHRLVALAAITCLWVLIFVPGLRSQGLWDPWEMEVAHLGRELLQPARILVLEKKQPQGDYAFTATLRKLAGSRRVAIRGPEEILKKGQSTLSLLSTGTGELNRRVHDVVVLDLALLAPARKTNEQEGEWINRLTRTIGQIDDIAAKNPQAKVVLVSSGPIDFKSILGDLAKARVNRAYRFLRSQLKLFDGNLVNGLPIPEVPYEVSKLAGFPVRYAVWRSAGNTDVGEKLLANALAQSRVRVQFKRDGQTYAIPVLNAYLTGFSYRVFGFSEFAARLPFALFGLLGLLLAFYWASEVFSPRAGLFSAMVLGTIPFFFLQARSVQNELPFMVSTMAMLVCYTIPLTRGRLSKRFLAGFGVAVTLIFFAKGLTGLLIALSVVGSLVLLTRDARQVALAPLAGLGAFFLLTLVAVQVSDWSYFIHFRFTNRLFSAGPPEETRTFDFFIRQVGFGALPWSALIPFALGRCIRWDREDESDLDAAETVKLSLFLWFAFGFFWYAVTTKEWSHLTFPAIGAAAVAVGLMLNDLWERDERNVLIGIVCLLVLGILLKEIRKSTEPLLGFLAFDPPFQGNDPSTTSSRLPLFPEGLKLTTIAKLSVLLAATSLCLYYTRVLEFLRKRSAAEITTGLLIIGVTLTFALVGMETYNSSYRDFARQRGTGLDPGFAGRVFAYTEVVAGYTLGTLLLIATVFHKRVIGWLGRFSQAKGMILAGVVGIAISATYMLHLVGGWRLLARGRTDRLAAIDGAIQRTLLSGPLIAVLIIAGLVSAIALTSSRTGARIATAVRKRVWLLPSIIAGAIAIGAFVIAGQALTSYLWAVAKINVGPDGFPFDNEKTAAFFPVVKGGLNYLQKWQFWPAIIVAIGSIILAWMGRAQPKSESTASTRYLPTAMLLASAGLMIWAAVDFGSAYVQFMGKNSGIATSSGELWRDVFWYPVTAKLAIFLPPLVGLLFAYAMLAPSLSRHVQRVAFLSRPGVLGSIACSALIVLMIAAAIMVGRGYAADYLAAHKVSAPGVASALFRTLKRIDVLALLLVALLPIVAVPLRQRLVARFGKGVARTMTAVGVLLLVTWGLYLLASVAADTRDAFVLQNDKQVVPFWVVRALSFFNPAGQALLSVLLGLCALIVFLDPLQQRLQRMRWNHFWWAAVIAIGLAGLDVIISLSQGFIDVAAAYTDEITRQSLAGLSQDNLQTRIAEAQQSKLAGLLGTGLVAPLALLVLGGGALWFNATWPQRSLRSSGGDAEQDAPIQPLHVVITIWALGCLGLLALAAIAVKLVGGSRLSLIAGAAAILGLGWSGLCLRWALKARQTGGVRNAEIDARLRYQHQVLSWVNPFQWAERRWLVPLLLIFCAFLFSLQLVNRFSKELSYHLSQKHILTMFKRSANTSETKGKLFKYGRFSKIGKSEYNFYTADIPSVNSSEVIEGLAKTEPRFYIVSKQDFSRLNYEYRRKHQGDHIKVLDDRSFSYILVSNRLRGSNEKLSAWRNFVQHEPDRNWLRRSVIRAPAGLPESGYEAFVKEQIRPLLPKTGFYPGYAEFAVQASKLRDWSKLRERGSKAVDWVPALIYLGYEAKSNIFARKDKLAINMYFLTVQEMNPSYKMFMHNDQVGTSDRFHCDHYILNSSQSNDAPCVGCFKTRHWLRGDIIIDRFEREIPLAKPTGPREMKIGFYTPKGPRLKILRSSNGVRHTNDDRLIIGTMIVR